MSAERTDPSKRLGLYIPTDNDFFRPDNANTARLVKLAPQLVAELPDNSVWQIAEIPCSMGKETWSVAAGLAVQGLRFQITAYDVNTEALSRTAQPYPGSIQQLEAKLANWRLPPACLDYFEKVDQDHIQPIQQLRQMVCFGRLDVRSSSPEPADVVIVNNLLSYWCHERAFPDIVRNLARCLRVDGVLTANANSLYTPPVKPALRREGLVDDETLGEDATFTTFFRYRPGRRKLTARPWKQRPRQ